MVGHSVIDFWWKSLSKFHSLSAADSKRAFVSFWWKNVHKYWLTANRTKPAPVNWPPQRDLNNVDWAAKLQTNQPIWPIDVSNFRDGRFHFRNTGVKGLKRNLISFNSLNIKSDCQKKVVSSSRWTHCIIVKMSKDTNIIIAQDQVLFSAEKYWYFSYFSMKTYCWHSVEVSHQGASNEYPHHMLSWKNKKNIMWKPILTRNYASSSHIKRKGIFEALADRQGPDKDGCSLNRVIAVSILYYCIHTVSLGNRI